jgi:hypothetical protein
MDPGAVVRPAIAYAAAVFAAGFVLGTLRTLALLALPDLDPVLAVALEVPVMVAVSWWIFGRIAARRDPPSGLGARIGLGALALVLLLAAETVLGLTLMGRSPAAQWAAFGTPEALLGLAGQLVFAAIPVLRRRRG